MSSKLSDLAILFADIAGSTRLFDVLGDEAARSKISTCLDMLSEVVATNDGTVIKTIGDEIMCTFPTAEDAATAACEMHEALENDRTEMTAAGPVSLRIRVGVHFGPTILEHGDVFGDAVNVAARMVALAKARQIITTKGTVDQLSSVMQASARLIDRAPVKGKDVMDIWELVWEQDDVTRISTDVINRAELDAHMVVSYHDTNLKLGRDRPQLVLGRSKTADVTVNESLASRQHVRIEFRRGKFFITDISTNGTYLKPAEADEMFLRREELQLSGSGMISLGRSFNEDPQEVVHFQSVH